MNTHSLTWPILLKQPQQDELLYLGSTEELIEQLSFLGPLNDLVIIDSEGTSYQLESDSRLSLCSPQLPIATLIDWVRLHASQAGHCCTSKLSANNIAQLFEIVDFIEQ
ncbi:MULTISPECIES: DUF4144 family protein [unclassified Shewanella]|uniref:DUF4144 family protein n=1 Tax=unclassified Shewanella TaxID=196818 RepID=UPI001BB970BB|nr:MULTISPECIES: DUF4144 family protein [unclassified Shewanella]GIU06848.1 hypothetical protein TUM4444_05400 [Shewanella sp. MBTL60-112-B1]GIU26268.1 hypothetical protein TUM4445_05260 [Shewanella sp. MBTL60-112-B2]